MSWLSLGVVLDTCPLSLHSHVQVRDIGYWVRPRPTSLVPSPVRTRALLHAPLRTMEDMLKRHLDLNEIFSSVNFLFLDVHMVGSNALSPCLEAFCRRINKITTEFIKQ